MLPVMSEDVLIFRTFSFCYRMYDLGKKGRVSGKIGRKSDPREEGLGAILSLLFWDLGHAQLGTWYSFQALVSRTQS